MRVPVLKALANPARIFFVPYNLAVLNFAFMFLLWLVLFWGGLIFTMGNLVVNPLYFVGALFATHSMLAAWSKKEPFLMAIVVARIRLWRKKIPNKMVV